MAVDLEQLRTQLAATRAAAVTLGALTGDQKNQVLQLIYDELKVQKEKILAANAIDLEREKESLSPALYQRLKLDSNKLETLLKGLQEVMGLEDPIGGRDIHRELSPGLVLMRVRVPLGVVAIIFESRPDVILQVVSLLFKSGNCGVLKGGREARNTNEMFVQVIRTAIAKSKDQLGFEWPQASLLWMDDRETIRTALKFSEYIDLVIPRGSNALVQDVMAMTKIPVLGHADGVCHVYVDSKARLDTAVALVLDSKLQYPAACNAVETVVLHSDIHREFIEQLRKRTKPESLELRGCERTRKVIPEARPVEGEDWHTEYGEPILAIKVVDSLQDAIAHINRYSSHHTDMICTQDKAAMLAFTTEIDSANVYINASTRFADGYRYGFGAEIGISTSRTHARGPVGLDGLVTTKYVLKGDGDLVADYVGDKAKAFTHKDLDRRAKGAGR